MTQLSREPLSPAGLRAAVESVRRRAGGLTLAYGLGLVLLVMAGLIVLGGVADWLLRLPAVPRLLGLLGAIGVLGWVGWRYVVVPLRRRATVGDVAGRLEEHFPQFDDRLRSGLAWEHADDSLRRRTLAEAGEIAGNVRFADVLRTRPALVTAASAAAALVALVVIASLLGPLAGTILGRLVDPLNPNHQWPKTFGVAALDLPDRHPAGRPLTVTASLDKGDPLDVEPTVHFQQGDGSVRRQVMARQEDGTFAATLDPKLAEGVDRGRLRVWVEAGDDATPPATVDLVTRPALVSAIASVTPPPYVGEGGEQRPRVLDLTAGPAVVGDGSTVTLTLGFNKPLREDEGKPAVALTLPDGGAGPGLTWQTTSPGVASASYSARETARFGVAATGRDGFEADLSPTFEVVVRPDRLPTVQIDQPRRNESRTAEAVVPVEVIAEDDFGFDDLTFVVEKLAAGDDAGWTATVPLLGDNVTQEPGTGGDGVRLRARYNWGLSELAMTAGATDLQPGDVLEFHAVADDNYDFGGETHEAVESGRLRVTIISQQELNRRAIGELRQVRDQVAAAKRRQDATARETAEWSEQTADKEALDDADIEAAGRLSRQQSSVTAQTDRLAEKAEQVRRDLEENRAEAEDLKQLAEDVSEALDRAAQGPMRSAAADIDEAAAEGAEQQSRQQEAESAQSEQREASERLDEVMKDMESIGSLRQSVDAVRELLEKQRELGERAEEAMSQTRGKESGELSDEERERAEDLAAEQERLAQETAEALERMAEQAEQMDDPAASEAMENAAQTGKQQDVEQSQRQAAQQQRQNNASRNQQAREQAEIGLRLVLGELERAEQEQMRRLQRQLAELVEQIERLVRRQAGHNLDNLGLRDVEPEALLVEQARRDDDAAVEPTIGRLSAGQEQTERNARDLSRPAEDAPEGGAIAEALTRAAARMERAAVFLRGDDLPAAYEPPQVQALAALVDALDAAREQEEQLREEMEQRQRAAVRDRLVALRDSQANEVNAPMAEHQAQADAGDLNRRERNRPIIEFAPWQAELVAEMEAVESALQEVGGTAFVYAGGRVRSGMNAVEAALRERDTGEGTRRTGDRVAAGLQRMIDALEVEAAEQRFDRNSQGGGQGGQGGGQQGPQLPPTTELKLIRLLQEQINDETEETEPADAAELDRLANDQGELRRVADEMLRKYSQGQMGLGPEPDPATLLPGEDAGEDADAIDAALDDRDLLDDLLGDAARPEPDAGEGGGEGAPAAGDDDAVRRLGDYSARSRQRLDVKDDPGPVTQAVQGRILTAIDDLIEQAKQQSQQQQQQAGGQPQPGQQPGPPQPGGEQADAGGQQPGGAQAGAQQQQQPGGQDGEGSGPPGQEANLGGELDETLANWGQLTPRQREAITEGAAARPLDAYRRLTDAFYQRLGDEASQEQP